MAGKSKERGRRGVAEGAQLRSAQPARDARNVRAGGGVVSLGPGRSPWSRGGARASPGIERWTVSDVSTNRRRSRSGVVIIVMMLGICVAPHPTVTAQATRPSPNNRLATLPGFSVEYPKKDWEPLMGIGSAVITFVHKSRQATIAIEQTRLKQPLAVSEIVELTAQLEEQEWQNRRPQILTFKHQLLDINGTRVIMLDFQQTGGQAPERVRLYSVPRGTSWFRVICTTTPAAFDK